MSGFYYFYLLFIEYCVVQLVPSSLIILLVNKSQYHDNGKTGNHLVVTRNLHALPLLGMRSKNYSRVMCFCRMLPYAVHD